MPLDWPEFFLTSLPVPASTWGDEGKGSLELPLRTIISQAFATGILPQGLLLVQFIHVRPVDLFLDFDLPMAVRETHVDVVRPALRLHGQYVQTSGTSFFRNAIASNLEKGLLCTISPHACTTVNIGSVEHIHAELQGLEPRRSPIEHAVGGSAWRYLATAEVNSSTDEHVEGPAWRPKGLRLPDLLRRLLNGRSDEYMSHISEMSQFGTAVLCVPKIFDLDVVGVDPRMMGGAGCVFILEGKAEEHALRCLYAIAHKLCGLVQSVHALGRLESQRLSARTFHFLRHSLGNTLKKRISYGTPPETVQRFLKLDEIMLLAGGCAMLGEVPAESWLQWSSAGFAGETIGQTIENALSAPPDFELRIHDSGIANLEVDPRFVAIVVELSRNFEHRLEVEGSSALRIERDISNPSALRISLRTRCTPSDAVSILNRLRGSSDEARGINWIVEMSLGLLGTGTGALRWTFTPVEGSTGEPTASLSNDRARWSFTAPESICRKAPKSGAHLWMDFEADGLFSLKRRES